MKKAFIATLLLIMGVIVYAAISNNHPTCPFITKPTGNAYLGIYIYSASVFMAVLYAAWNALVAAVYGVLRTFFNGGNVGHRTYIHMCILPPLGVILGIICMRMLPRLEPTCAVTYPEWLFPAVALACWIIHAVAIAGVYSIYQHRLKRKKPQT
jgi:hypothetical protein